MKIGYIFPGQGTQTVGIGKDIYDKYEEARNVYKIIDKSLNENIEKLTYENTQEELNKTENTQITIYAMSMAILEILNSKGIKYKEVTDIDEMQKLGLMSVPYLSVDGELLDFVAANKWINNESTDN